MRLRIAASLLLAVAPLAGAQAQAAKRAKTIDQLAAAFDSGMILASLGLGLVAEWLGYRGVFWVAAGTVAAGAATSYLLGRR